jgi:CheY-like chemotaxis protein
MTPHAQETGRSAPRRPPLRALIVDDHPTNRIVLKAILGELGCEVGLASDGVEGVRAAASAPFDVVVMDRNMPVCNGDEATRLIRAARTASSGAFIVRWTTDPCGRLSDVGYDAMLDKPVSFAAVVAMLERAARHRQRRPRDPVAPRAA